MKITILYNINNSKIPIEIEPNDSIITLKQKLIATGIDANTDDIIFVFRGKKIDDKKTIFENNITDNGFVHCAIRKNKPTEEPIIQQPPVIQPQIQSQLAQRVANKKETPVVQPQIIQPMINKKETPKYYEDSDDEDEDEDLDAEIEESVEEYTTPIVKKQTPYPIPKKQSNIPVMQSDITEVNNFLKRSDVINSLLDPKLFNDVKNLINTHISKQSTTFPTPKIYEEISQNDPNLQKYKSQLDMMHALGIADDKTNVDLLIKAKGNVEAAVNAYYDSFH